MLQTIRVRDLAVIDQVEVEFDSGLTILTGETGAGKSILVDALGLVLGQRADGSALRTGADRAEVTALFGVGDIPAAKRWLVDRELDDGEECLLRRVISKDGRSRAFVNGSAVTLRDLKLLSAELVDIHGQHANQSLQHPSTQRHILDFHGGSQNLAEETAAAYQQWSEARSTLEQRLTGHAEQAAQLDLWRFQLEELSALGASPGEAGELTAERNRLNHVADLADRVEESLQCLSERDGAASELVGRALRAMGEASAMDEELRPAEALITEADIQLTEAASTLRQYRADLAADPERLEWLENRLAKMRELARKHQVEADALPGIEKQIAERLDEAEGSNNSLDTLEQQVGDAKSAYFKLANKLSDERRRAAKSLSDAVTQRIHQLGMEKGRFYVEVAAKSESEVDASGADDIQFLVTMNPGQAPGPINKVASGGELSRLSLAIQVVAASATGRPTMVFDEVDAGVGGGVAEIVGRQLKSVSSDHQVLCVTHLPQVASLGDAHYRVSKLSDGKNTRTRISSLSDTERVDELSRMLGGVEITETTRAHAEEMAQKGRESA